MVLFRPPRDEIKDAKILSSKISIKKMPDKWYIDNLSSPGTHLRPNSINTYTFDIRRILNDVGAKSIHDLLTHPKKFKSVIYEKDDLGIERKKTMFRTINAIMKHASFNEEHPKLVELWRVLSIDAVDAYEQMKKSNIPSKKQEKYVISWEEVLRTRDEQVYGSDFHLLLSLYTYLPPRRQLDYTNFRVYTNPDDVPVFDHNHIHLYSNKYKESYVFVSKYKTAKFYKGFYDSEIPDEFLKLVKYSFAKKPRMYLFEMAKVGGPYKLVNSHTQRVNRRLKAVFNNGAFTVNSFRHIFSTFLDTIPNMSIAEREKFALKMGHSYRESKEYAFIDTSKALKTRVSSEDTKNNIDDIREKSNIHVKMNEKIKKMRADGDNIRNTTPGMSKAALRKAEVAKLFDVEECFRRKGNNIERIRCPK